MFTTVLTILLGALLLYAVWPAPEGFTQYPDNVANDPLVLAKQNEENLKDLQKRMDLLSKMNDQVTSTKSMCDANTQNISALTDQCR